MIFFHTMHVTILDCYDAIQDSAWILPKYSKFNLKDAFWNWKKNVKKCITDLKFTKIPNEWNDAWVTLLIKQKQWDYKVEKIGTFFPLVDVIFKSKRFLQENVL